MQGRRIQLEDTAAVTAFLTEHLESSMFCLSNLEKGRLKYSGQPYEAEYLGVFRDHTIIGIAAHTWLGTLLIQAPDPDALHVLEGLLPRFLSRPFKGLLGPREQCLELMERLNLDRTNAVLDQDEPLYRLEIQHLQLPSLFTATNVRIRAAAETDLAVLARWRACYLTEVMNFPPSDALRKRARTEIEAALLENRCFVLEHAGTMVSCCIYNASTVDAVQIGGIWTPPEFRGRQYGRTILAGALQHAYYERDLKIAVLFIDDGNRAALSGVEALGFERVGRYSFTLWDTDPLVSKRSR